MINIKNAIQIEKMRAAGRIVRDVLCKLEDNIKEGVSTKHLDDIAREYILSQGATPSFLNYNGYPASVCVSINEQVVHGIPSSKTIIKEGDIVSIDVGAYLNGYHGDAARSVGVGNIIEEDKRLIEITEQSFYNGVSLIKEGIRIGDFAEVIQKTAESNGFSVVRAMVGHGIGANMHEDPEVPNFGTAGRGIRLKAGMVIAIEPMINAGTYEVVISDDGWTVSTADGRKSAHYENTVLVTNDGYELLTK